jgi:hypothetical protein
MPLTRHLYELDEVTAALQLCLRRGGARAPFWAWELIVSDEANIAFTTIRHAWLLWGGGHDPSILDVPCPLVADATPWLHLLNRTAAAITTAGTLIAEKLLTRVQQLVAPPPPPTTQIHPRVAAAFATAVADELPDTSVTIAFWNALAIATTARPPNRITALWLLQAAADRLCADSLWTALQMIAATTGNPEVRATVASLRKAATPHPESQLLHQAAAVFVIAGHPAAPPPPPTASATALRDWETWNSLVDNCRAARIHAIPPDALHTGTPRGSMSAKYTNDADIHNPVALLPAGCRWWRTQAAAAGLQADPTTEAVTWPADNDATLEAFYERHFPLHVDIPDEWSAADRAKSHGCGTQETAPPVPSVPLLTDAVDDDTFQTAIRLFTPPVADH